MKFWKTAQLRHTGVVITKEKLKSNRNLRRFKRVRTFFLVFNPIVSMIALFMIIIGVL
ncbi:MAG: hypothetical protein M1393_07465 [Candidatus Thermoplasmatota archaeon]|jgi:hypothetical protein|nr:hypothetical protein [Candidatus Thermoplasmatota archaeon]